MARKKNGFWKKTGCILISASVILTGWTFLGSSTSDAGLSDDGTSYSFTSDNNSVTVGDGLTGNSSIISIDDTGSCGADIGNSAFANCTSLVTVTIKGEASIGTEAFSGCTSLSTVYFGSLSSFDSTAFRECASLTSLTVAPGGVYSTSDDALYYGTTLIYVPPVKTQLTIPDGTTAIAADAFYGSNVSYLKVENASEITSIGSQTNWPLFETNESYVLNVYAPGGANTELEDYFDDYVVKYGETRCHLHFDNADDAPTTYTVVITETADDGSFSDVITYAEQAEGAVIYPTPRSGYTCSDSYTVTAEDTHEYTFVYTAASSDSTTYTIKYQLLSSSGTEVTTQAITTTTAPASYSPQSTYSYNGVTYTLTSTTATVSGTIYTYIYKAADSSGDNSSDSSGDNTSNGDNSSGGGNSSGGSSSGGSSSSSGGSSSGSSSSSSSAAAAPATVSDVAKTTAKYNIIEGAGQIVSKSNGPVRIVCDGPVEKLSYILMDGNIVDRGNYTIASGSTILTFTGDYVATLSEGDHAVQFQYTDGYAITGLRITSASTKTTTTVTYKVSSDGSISSGHTKDATPTTADGFDNRYLLCIAIFLLGAGAILFSRQKKLEAILAGERDD